MSEENVEIVRAAFEPFSRGEFSALADLPDHLELILAPEMPDAGTYRGAEARRWMVSWVESFERLTQELEKIRDVGDGCVLAEFIQRGWSAGSDVPVELPHEQLHWNELPGLRSRRCRRRTWKIVRAQYASFGQITERWLEAWSSYSDQIEEIIDGGDCCRCGQHQRSWAHQRRRDTPAVLSVFEMREGRILRLREYVGPCRSMIPAAGVPLRGADEGVVGREVLVAVKNPLVRQSHSLPRPSPTRLAGMWEFKNNNTFGATAFSSFGAL